MIYEFWPNYEFFGENDRANGGIGRDLASELTIATAVDVAAIVCGGVCYLCGVSHAITINFLEVCS